MEPSNDCDWSKSLIQTTQQNWYSIIFFTFNPANNMCITNIGSITSIPTIIFNKFTNTDCQT